MNQKLSYLICFLAAVIISISSPFIYGQELTASWYSVESCKREGTSGIMANGKVLNDQNYTAASWDYRFGTILKVTNLNNGKVVRVQITDRGPSKRLYRSGRVLDLSVAAFKAIADLRSGIIPVKIEEVHNGS